MNDVRKSGLKLFLVAGVIAAVLAFVASKLTAQGGKLLGYSWGIPGAFALAGLVQVISGVRFSELASRWDALRGWQRGVLGTLIFLVAVGLIFLAIFIFVTVVYDS
jgi:hypothetical protein